jgi:regulator of RNase E activity RraA
MVRDLDELRALGLPVFARGLIARSGSDLRGFGEVFAPVACGMVPVLPGDVVVGSIDGVVVVPRTDVTWVVDQARNVQQRKGSKRDVESRLRDAREGTLRFSHEAVQRALDESGCAEFAYPWESRQGTN